MNFNCRAEDFVREVVEPRKFEVHAAERCKDSAE